MLNRVERLIFISLLGIVIGAAFFLFKITINLAHITQICGSLDHTKVHGRFLSGIRSRRPRWKACFLQALLFKVNTEKILFLVIFNYSQLQEKLFRIASTPTVASIIFFSFLCILSQKLFGNLRNSNVSLFYTMNFACL